MPRPRNDRKSRPIVELAKVVLGGMAGITVGVLVMWHGFGRDPLGIFEQSTVKEAAARASNDADSRPQKAKPSPRKPERKSPSKNASKKVPSEDRPQPSQRSVPARPVAPREAWEADTASTAAAVDPLPSSSIDDTSKRHRPPDGDTYKAKLDQVQEIFAKEYDGAFTPEDSAALAHSLMDFADDVQDDPNGRFVVIREALKFASQAGDVELGEKAIDQLVADFELEEPLMRAYFFLGTVTNLQTNDDRHRVATEALALVPQLVEDRHTGVAMNLTTLSRALAVATKDDSLRDRADKEVERLKTLQRDLETAELARKTLEENPDDSKAQLIYGRHLCLREGDWKGGLELLAGSGAEPVHRIAQLDLDSPDNLAGMLELADAWNNFSQAESENSGFAQRAMHWYELCRKEARGLTRAKIEKRLTELATAGGLPPLPDESPAGNAAVIGRDGKKFTGHRGAVADVKFSKRGGWLLSGSADETIRLWDVATGRELRRITGHDKGIRAVSFMPDERRVVSCGWDGTIRTWELVTGRQLQRINADAEVVYDISLSPDGAAIASCGRDGVVHLWSAESGDELASFAGHTGYVLSVQFSPDGKFIASAGQDHIVRLWDVEAKREAERFLGGKGAFLHSVDVSPDGQHILTCGNGAWMWRRGTARPLIEFDVHDTIRCATFDPGVEAVALGGDNKTVAVFQTTGRKLHDVGRSADIVRCVTFSPDGSLLAFGGGGEVAGSKMLRGDDFSIYVHRTAVAGDEATSRLPR